MQEQQVPTRLQHGPLELDTESRVLFVDRQEVAVTPIEYEMLLMLLQHPGRVFTRQEFIAKCWPEDAWVAERTVDVNIGRLRKKLGSAAPRLKSRIGFGYLLSAC